MNRNRKPEKAIIGVIRIGFLLWSAAFIFRSSCVAVEGIGFFVYLMTP